MTAFKNGDRVIVHADKGHRLGFLNGLRGAVVPAGQNQFDDDEASVILDGIGFEGGSSYYYIPTDLLEILSDTSNWEVAWLAGLFEGEGNFNVIDEQRGRKANLRVCIRSCDEDVIRLAHAVSGVGCVFGPYSNGRSTSTGQPHKDFWIWQVAARAEAVEITRRLYPLLGARRQEQAAVALTKIGEPVGHSAD